MKVALLLEVMGVGVGVVAHVVQAMVRWTGVWAVGAACVAAAVGRVG